MRLNCKNSAPTAISRPSTSGRASQGFAAKRRTHHQELGGEDAERRKPGDGRDADHQPPADQRVGLGEAAHLGDLLRALHLRDVADGEEDRRLGQRMQHHVQQAGEIGERAAQTESEGDQPHMLDGGIGEQPLDVAPPVEHEGAEQERDEAHQDHQRARRQSPRIAGHQHLAAKQRVERDVEQQARQTAVIGVGPSAWASGSQACSGNRPILVP